MSSEALKSKIGHISLLIAVGGLIATEIGIYVEVLQGNFWRILATGFEAGTIGALADWFAVSALFHKIPIPLISRHTNIIVKNRHKLTEAIVELVTTKWLSSEIIHKKLQGVGIAAGIFKMLEKPKNLDLALDITRQLLHRFVANLDNPQVIKVIQIAIKGQINNLQLAKPLGTWMESFVLNRDHHQMVDMLLKEATKALDDPSTRDLIQEKLKWALASYEKKDLVKRTVVWLGKKTGGIDIDLLTDRLLEMARLMADEAESNAEHPLRLKLDQSLLELARNLREEDPAMLDYINGLKQRMLKNKQLHSMFLSVMLQIKVLVKEQLAGSKTSFMGLLKTKAERLIQEMQEDQSVLDQIDDWMKETIAHMVNKYHHEVGNMVRESLLKLDDQELVLQIKEKVGDDLQYIRLNGAVVGGLVGILIAVARILFLQ